MVSKKAAEHQMTNKANLSRHRDFLTAMEITATGVIPLKKKKNFPTLGAIAATLLEANEFDTNLLS